MTDAPGQGPVEPRPSATPPPFGAPTPGSVAPEGASTPGAAGPATPGYATPAAPGYGAPTHGTPTYGTPAYGAPNGTQAYGQPSRALSPGEERTWGMLGHLSAILAGFFGVAFLGPLIVYLMYKDRSPFVRRHAAESLNFQISLLIYMVVGGIVGLVLSIITFGLALFVLIPLGIALTIAALVFIVMACIAANDGREYRYPLTLRFVH